MITGDINNRSCICAPQDFVPMLLRTDASWDFLEKGDELILVSCWQNIGTKPANARLSGFIDLEFGYQRMTETQPKQYRINWDPYPGMQHWQSGDIRACACRWKVPEIWGGTYRVFIGICDDQGVPVAITGKDGQSAYRTYVGDIEIGWGWGRPALLETRKPWSTAFNPVREMAGQPVSPDELTLDAGITVEFDRHAPVLRGVRDKQTAFRFPAILPEIFLRNVRQDDVLCSYGIDMSMRCGEPAAASDKVIYPIEIYYKTKVISCFDLCCSLFGRRLDISLENVWEQESYELLEVRLPSVISAGGDTARMVDFYMGGRLISPESSPPMGFEHVYDVRNAAAIYHDSGVIVIESSQLDNKLYQSIQQDYHGKRAVIGFGLVYKVRSHGRLESIPAASVPSLSLELLDQTWGEPSWQAAARFLRRGLTGINRDLYDRALIYKYVVAFGPCPDESALPASEMNGQELTYPWKRLKEGHSFQDALDMIHRVCNLTDGCKQVVYLVGWQYQGHDTGYPYVFETDPRGGTRDELVRCIQDAAHYNAILSMHDNYDDTYPSPHYDPAIVARDAFGEPYKGFAWSAGLCRIISPVRYVQTGLMAERIARTIETYGIHTTYHLDVLTSEVRRYDFDPAWRAAADQNLKAKKEIVREFNQHGIDITSETLSHPFARTIGLAWTSRDDRREILFPGETYIPLTAMVYHGIIQYNNFSLNDEDILNGIITGSYAGWGDISDLQENSIKAFYLQGIPMGLLYNYKIEDYQEDECQICVQYELGSRVKVNKKTRQYEIIIDGKLVAYDWSTFAPGFSKDTYLAYSANARDIVYPVPGGWHRDSPLQAVMLTEKGEGDPVDFDILEDKIIIHMPAYVPVRIMQVDPNNLEVLK